MNSYAFNLNKAENLDYNLSSSLIAIYVTQLKDNVIQHTYMRYGIAARNLNIISLGRMLDIISAKLK